MVSIESYITHQLEDAGATFRVYFITRIIKEDGSREWHYFGVTESQVPRTTLEPNRPDLQTLPYFEHAYVSFPQSMQDIPNESRVEIMSIAIPAGLNREGVW